CGRPGTAGWSLATPPAADPVRRDGRSPLRLRPTRYGGMVARHSACGLAGTAGWSLATPPAAWPVRREWLLAIPSAAEEVGLWLLAAAADLQWRVAGARRVAEGDGSVGDHSGRCLSFRAVVAVGSDEA
ncbi:hypothetical protein ACFVWG_15805, partial [Kribbella sp. NPDC058245]|uniref:hypothetical protein n=1 Tax=Kribbella sp. NPDC058245 TaxID=3346399 RepID=UPI0036E22435